MLHYVSVREDERFGGAGRAPDLDGSAHHHEEWHRFVTDVDENFSSRDRPSVSMRRDPRHLPGRQCWKQPFCRGGRVM
jgi:hypothetical protein